MDHAQSNWAERKMSMDESPKNAVQIQGCVVLIYCVLSLIVQLSLLNSPPFFNANIVHWKK